MRFSILHISDLHRDLRDEVANGPLLESLIRDVERYAHQDPIILPPSICIVSGDLVYGVQPHAPDASNELQRQYAQAEEFLVWLADAFFRGDRERVVLLPGNHDVSYPTVLASAKRIEIPADSAERRMLTDEFFAPKSKLRWSWSEYCFYRITDDALYEYRLNNFTEAYEHFYQGRRVFAKDPKEQFDIFDYPDLGLSVVALNSCYRNDPLHRAGGFEPTAFSAACRELRNPKRAGWLMAGAWHHNISGGPLQDDYLDTEFIQVLIDTGVSLGFHGHQHSHDCVDERYRLGPEQRKITLVSASTLCAEPHKLKPGVPRGYNVVEVDTDVWYGRVHSRQMVNSSFTLPVWGPGHFYSTGNSHVDFDLCKPISKRPELLDTALALDRADQLLGNGQWAEALSILAGLRDIPLARPFLLKALSEHGNDEQTIEMLWPPASSAEAVLIGAAILRLQSREKAKDFLQLQPISQSEDASVKEISRRIRIKWPQ